MSSNRDLVTSVWLRHLSFLASIVLFALLGLGAHAGPLLLGSLAPIALLPVVVCGYFVVGFIATLGEWAELIRDRKMQVIHGLEHATIAVLEENGAVVWGGRTWPSRFEVTVDAETPVKISQETVRTAVENAAYRIRLGQTDLAISSQCGTSILVALALGSLIVLCLAAVGLFATVTPVTMLWLAGAAELAMLGLARPLGRLAQKRLTVSTDFRAVQVHSIARTMWENGAAVVFAVQLEVE